MALPKAWTNLTAVTTTRYRLGLRRLMMVFFLAGLAAVLFHGSIAFAAQYFHAVPYVKTGSASFSGQCGNITRGNEGLAVFGVPKELQTPDAIDGSLTSVKARIDSVIDPNNRMFVGQERTLSYAVEVGVEAVGQGPGGSNRTDTIGIYPTVNSVGLDGSCTFLYTWAFKEAGPQSWKVSLTSQEVSGSAPPNNGQMRLNGRLYNLAMLSDALPSGTYDVEYLPGGPFDTFDHWGAFDGVQVNSATANPASVTVSGAGNLVAYYRRSTPAASLSVTVLRSGGLSGTDLNALVLYKNDAPVQNVDPTETSYKWTNLEPGTYNVESYINDMFAGETGSFVLKSGDALSKTITATAASNLTVTVYYSDKTTAFSNAQVEVYSHELDKNPSTAKKWASGTTNANGQVTFSLQPSILAAEYYVAKVTNDGSTVKPVKLATGGNTVKVTMSVVQTAGTFSVTGKIQYRFSTSVNLVNVGRATIELYDNVVGGVSFLLASTVTEDDGSYSFTTGDDGKALLNIDEWGTRDISISVRSSTPGVVSVVKPSAVETALWIPYSVDSPISWDIHNGLTSIDLLIEDESAGAWAIQHTILEGYLWMARQSIQTRPAIEVRWPADKTQQYSNPLLRLNWIEIERWLEWSPDAILHEYGHAVMIFVYAGANSSIPTCYPHDPGVRSNPGCAWSEGWADFFAVAAQSPPYVGKYVNYDIEDNGGTQGDNDEAAIAGILWDIFAPAVSANDVHLGLGIDEITTVLKATRPGTIYDFWNGWVQTYGDSANLRKIFENHGVRLPVPSAKAGTPTATASPTPTPTQRPAPMPTPTATPTSVPTSKPKPSERATPVTIGQLFEVLDSYFQGKPSSHTGGTIPTIRNLFDILDAYFS